MNCAAVCDPSDYKSILENMKNNEGCTTIKQRFDLAKKVFAMTSKYDTVINNYFQKQNFTDVKKIYNLK